MLEVARVAGRQGRMMGSGNRRNHRIEGCYRASDGPAADDNLGKLARRLLIEGKDPPKETVVKQYSSSRGQTLLALARRQRFNTQ